jgi:hypothetical protein
LKGQKKASRDLAIKEESFLLWKIEGKPIKFLRMTFACRSPGYLFYGIFWHVMSDV